MSEMDKLFGSDSEESGENEEEQQNEQSNNEQHEGSENNDDENGDGEHNDENTNEHHDNDEEEQAEDHNDDENNHNDDDDDDDEVIKKKAPKQAAEVFGDELADLSDSDDNEQNNESRGANEEAEDEDHERGDHEGEEGNEEQVEAEEEEEVETEQLIDIEIPRVKTDLGKDVHFVKLPNFLSVEPRPFDRETYEDENPKGEALDEEGKTRVRLKVENTIRWRYEKDSAGNDVKQSNARIVKWSDGSLSLYLGNEIFDVYKTAMQGDHNHLFVRQGNVLHGQTVFKTKLSFRPYSIDSMTHRKMTMSLVEHGSKTKKVKILNEIAKNPENKRLELMKQEEEKLKAASRRQNQQRRLREKSHSKGLSANYLEDRYQSDEDTGGISISDIKNKFKRGVAAGSSKNVSIYSSSDESDRERRLNKAKSSHNDSDSGSDHEAATLDDDDDDIDRDRKAHSSNKKKKVVMDDEDE